MKQLSSILLFSFLFFSIKIQAQNTYLPIGDEAYNLIDRLEVASGSFSDKVFLSNKSKGLSRKDVYEYLTEHQVESYYSGKSLVDNFHLFETMSRCGEWKKPNSDGAEQSRYSIGPFYKYQTEMLLFRDENNFFSLNPILGVELGMASNPNSKFIGSLTEGFETRGRLGKHFGFYLSLTNTNLTLPDYSEKYISDWRTLPGAGRYSFTGNGYQYLRFDANLNTEIIKDYISLDVGNGRHFFGDGMRTLFLSDNSGGGLYVGLNTKIWRLNYQNLFMQLHPNNIPGMYPEKGYKYAAIHYLSTNVRPWLNVGLFEAITFSRNGGYEIRYMNPIILYRTVERDLGSPDKVALGVSANAIVANRFKFYGQFLLNEFTASQFFKRNGYWANKWGAQIGIKYFDVFTVPNLDFKAELNMVRPYTFSHAKSTSDLAVSNYSSWNQPLAHPLGADFQEIIGSLSYQPRPRWDITGTFMFYRQGKDTGTVNAGSNIFKDYMKDKTGTFGVYFMNGPTQKVAMLNLNVSFELRPRLFLYAEGTYRHSQTELNILPEQRDLFYGLGARLNINKRMYNWY